MDWDGQSVLQGIGDDHDEQLTICPAGYLSCREDPFHGCGRHQLLPFLQGPLEVMDDAEMNHFTRVAACRAAAAAAGAASPAVKSFASRPREAQASCQVGRKTNLKQSELNLHVTVWLPGQGQSAKSAVRWASRWIHATVRCISPCQCLPACLHGPKSIISKAICGSYPENACAFFSWLHCASEHSSSSSGSQATAR